MPNRIKGEAALDAGGRHYRLLLTLGALAEIEDGLGLQNLGDVAARLKTVRAADLAVVAAALLRGGGHELGPADVLRLPVDLGTLIAAVTDAFDAAGLNEARSTSEVGQIPALSLERLVESRPRHLAPAAGDVLEHLAPRMAHSDRAAPPRPPAWPRRVE